MRLTKDECRILHACLADTKYNLANNFNKADALKLITAIDDLEDRMQIKFADGRRVGRTTQNSFIDTLKRFAKL